jgi:hypothetical protein
MAYHLTQPFPLTLTYTQACLDACRVLAFLIHRCLSHPGALDKATLLSPEPYTTHPYWQAKPLGPVILPIAQGAYRGKSASEVMGRSRAACLPSQHMPECCIPRLIIDK